MKLILASNNQGKIREIRKLLPGVEILSLRDIGYTEPIPEPFATFEENARTKAETIHARFGDRVLSDDSGICVSALGGAPGVYSARYAGEGASDTENNELLLRKLRGVSDRAAYYYVVLCLISEDGSVRYFEGRCDGTIADAPQGSGGFGYDPLFIPDGFDASFGELPEEIKGGISHRGRALKQLQESGIFNTSQQA